MSTRDGGGLRERQRRVGYEGAVDDVREAAFEGPERLGAGVTVSLAALVPIGKEVVNLEGLSSVASDAVIVPRARRPRVL